MSYVSIGQDGWLHDRAGDSFYPVGINYVASYVCTNFWEDFREEVIQKDLERIAALGLRVVRIPLFWGYMEPEQGCYNQDIYPKFERFLGWCRALDLYVMPWFLVGVATRDYDVPFRRQRPFFTGDMVEAAKKHIQQFVSHYHTEEQIFMWDLCDEPEYYSRHPGAEQWPFHREDLKNWVRTLCDGVKEIDQNHLVTLGFGHIASENFGYHVQDMAEILDLMVVTCYPLGVSPEAASALRNNYFLPFYVAFNRPRQNAVLTCEAPGFSSIMFSEKVIGQYFRSCLYSNLSEGSMGVLPWCFNDFSQDIWHQCPLEDYVYEPRFGIVTNDGRLKPSGQELLSFAQAVRLLGITDYRREAPRAAIILPRNYYQSIPTSFRRIYVLYMMLKGCGLGGVDLVWQGEPLEGYQYVFIGDTSGFTSSFWCALGEYANQGGNLAYFFDQPTGLSAYFNSIFGVTVESPSGDYTAKAVAAPGGILGSSGEKKLAACRKCRLEVTPETAEAVVSYDDGAPLYLRNRYGSGSAFLITSQLLDGLLDVREEAFLDAVAWDILGDITRELHSQQPVTSRDHRLEISCFVKDSDSTLLVLVNNHSRFAVTAGLQLRHNVTVLGGFRPDAQGKLEDFTFSPSTPLEFAPCETVILLLSQS